MSHFFTPKSETHDGTTAFFEVDAPNTDVYAYDMDSLDNLYTPAMARLPTCLYTPCQIYVSTSKSRNDTTTDYHDRETMNARHPSTERYSLVYPSHH